MAVLVLLLFLCELCDQIKYSDKFHKEQIWVTTEYSFDNNVFVETNRKRKSKSYFEFLMLLI